MILTWPLFAAGLTTGLLAFVAHALMRTRTYHTPIPRYIVGVLIALVPWAGALLAQEADASGAIVGAFFSFGCGMIGTWVGYETDPPLATGADVDRILAAIEGEHESDDCNG